MKKLELIRGRDWQNLDINHQNEYIEKAFRYWRGKGFPHYQLNPSQIRKRFLHLVSTNTEKVFLPMNELQASTIGLGLANYYHPQIWSTKCSNYKTPMEVFLDDALLKACIRKALTLWPRRKAGSASVLRKILGTYKDTRRVSNFRPAVAKAIYDKFTTQNAKILDISAGYGGRLLGSMALNRNYIGYEPSSHQFDGLNKMIHSIKSLGLTDSKIELHQVCAEDSMQSEKAGSFDLIFTSPPYFDLEQYSDEYTQSYLRYPSYSEWREKFLWVIIEQSYRLLTTNGLLILNVANTRKAPIANDTKHIATGFFRLIATYYLRMAVLPFHKCNNNSLPYRHEPIYVFEK